MFNNSTIQKTNQPTTTKQPFTIQPIKQLTNQPTKTNLLIIINQQSTITNQLIKLNQITKQLQPTYWS